MEDTFGGYREPRGRPCTKRVCVIVVEEYAELGGRIGNDIRSMAPTAALGHSADGGDQVGGHCGDGGRPGGARVRRILRRGGLELEGGR
jgi:hypothetical protein